MQILQVLLLALAATVTFAQDEIELEEMQAFLVDVCLSNNEFVCLLPNGTITCVDSGVAELACNFSFGLANCSECMSLGFYWCYAVNTTSLQNEFLDDQGDGLCAQAPFCDVSGDLGVQVSSLAQCPSMCSRSIAYWRKHSSEACCPQPWLFGLENYTICNQTYLSILDFDGDDDDHTNVTIQLEQQLIRLQLNIANGVQVSDDTITDIDNALSFLENTCGSHLTSAEKSLERAYLTEFKTASANTECGSLRIIVG